MTVTQEELEALAAEHCVKMEDMCDCIVELPEIASVPADDLALQV